MTRYLYIDTETYSETPIKNGTHVYAENAEVMLFAYAIGDGPVEVWDATDGSAMPSELDEHLRDGPVTIVAHNGAAFDRTVIRHALGIHIMPERLHDTMVQALCHGLPGSLATLCQIFGLEADEAKSKEGRKLINLFCKPRPKNSKIRRATRETHPTEWQQFIEYAKQDIVAMRALKKKMPDWNYTGSSKERNLWLLDQTINDRGVAVDLELAHAAIAATDRAQHQLAADTRHNTFGMVESSTQRDVMLRFILDAYGVELPDLQASTLERRINDPDLPDGLRELLSIRLQASTTSTSKYKALIKATSPDGRLRGLLQFCGASRTGRWAGRTFQPQNLPSKNLPPQSEIDLAIEALAADSLDLIFPEPMKMISACIRSCLIASPGKKLVVADLSNIEGRDAAWLAGEEWKLDAFREFDAGTGHDLYALAYAKSFGVTPEDVMDNKKQGGNWRQIGKVMELALGYQGGVGAFLTFSLVYGIDLEAMATEALPMIPRETLDEARKAWVWAKDKNRTFGLSKPAYMACDSLKRLWRAAHPEISSYWEELEMAARWAIQEPGRDITCRKVTLRRQGNWLRIILPSGRSLCYASPKVEDNKISYMGINQYSRKWCRLKTYGGKLFENICQAVARDVMAENMPHIEESGYDVLLTVHDEVVTEAPDNLTFDAARLSSLLAALPDWAEGLPLAAAGFESQRYKKG